MRCLLTRDQIVELAHRYEERKPFEQNMGRENRALLAGRRISEGDYSLENLMLIVEWKSPRPKSRVAANDPSDITEALATMVSSKNDRTKVSVLVGLKGVQVPMASAILTAFNPERYIIIDVRALETLGVKQSSPTIDYYLKYLAFCRTESNTRAVCLRDFDRALWQWSKERSP